MGNLFLTKEARIYSGAKTASSINGAGKTGPATCKRKKLEHFLTPYTKINSKWIKEINLRPELSTLRGKQAEHKSNDDVNQSKILYDPPPRVMEIKINKWDLIKLKSFAQQRKL